MGKWTWIAMNLNLCKSASNNWSFVLFSQFLLKATKRLSQRPGLGTDHFNLVMDESVGSEETRLLCYIVIIAVFFWSNEMSINWLFCRTLTEESNYSVHRGNNHRVRTGKKQLYHKVNYLIAGSLFVITVFRPFKFKSCCHVLAFSFESPYSCYFHINYYHASGLVSKKRTKFVSNEHTTWFGIWDERVCWSVLCHVHEAWWPTRCPLHRVRLLYWVDAFLWLKDWRNDHLEEPWRQLKDDSDQTGCLTPLSYVHTTRIHRDGQTIMHCTFRTHLHLQAIAAHDGDMEGDLFFPTGSLMCMHMQYCECVASGNAPSCIEQKLAPAFPYLNTGVLVLDGNNSVTLKLSVFSLCKRWATLRLCHYTHQPEWLSCHLPIWNVPGKDAKQRCCLCQAPASDVNTCRPWLDTWMPYVPPSPETGVSDAPSSAEELNTADDDMYSTRK